MYIPWSGFSTVQPKIKKPRRMKKHVHSDGCLTNPVMAQCVEMRERTRSFDLHHIGGGKKEKGSLLSRLFRSSSDNQMKINKSSSPTSSPRSSSPLASPAAPQRRRFMRVIRDDHAHGEEYVNPHVVRKYNKGFWERNYIQKSQSLDDSVIQIECHLPYTVTGPTILKKHHSLDEEGLHSNTEERANSPNTVERHAKFKDEVEVLEYDIKEKCLFIHDASVSREKLHDDSLMLELKQDIFSISMETCSIGVFVMDTLGPIPESPLKEKPDLPNAHVNKEISLKEDSSSPKKTAETEDNQEDDSKSLSSISLMSIGSNSSEDSVAVRAS